MFKLYGIPSQNTLKPAFVLDALELDYEFQNINVPAGEHKEDFFLKINPIGKVPALKHGEFCIAESGAICRYLANVENSPLYSKDPVKRAQTDQWLDYFTCHLGRWLSILFFEKVVKGKFDMGEANLQKCEEATSFVNQQMTIVNNQLSNNKYFAGEELSIADYAAFAYIDQAPAIDYDLSPYPHVISWYKQMSSLNSVIKTKSKVKM